MELEKIDSEDKRGKRCLGKKTGNCFNLVQKQQKYVIIKIMSVRKIGHPL
jgi:hypothetical protein